MTGRPWSPRSAADPPPDRLRPLRHGTPWPGRTGCGGRRRLAGPRFRDCCTVSGMHWHAGFNQPGYGPDPTEPSLTFATWRQARDFLVEEVRWIADVKTLSDQVSARLYELADNLGRLAGGDWCEVVALPGVWLAFWIMPCAEADCRVEVSKASATR